VTVLSDSPAGQAQERAAELFAQLADYQREGVRRGIPEVLAEIYRTRAWAALGHDTFEVACDALLGGWRIALPREDRRVVVAELRDQGVPTRQIASIVGAGKGTVDRDLKALGAPNGAPATVTGHDGKTYPARVTQTTRTTEATKVEQVVDTETGEILNETVTSEQWEAENALQDVLQADPGVRAATLRHRFIKELLPLFKLHMFDPVEMARIDPERLDDLNGRIAALTAFRDAYAAALPTGLRIVKDS
jgi:hypothetical protein